MKDDALRSRIDGVVTLATPFLHAQPRPYRENENSSVFAAWAAGLMGLFIAAMSLLILVPGIEESPATRTSLSVAGSIAFAVGLGMLLRHVIIVRLHAREAGFLARLRLPTLPMEKALIVRVAGDEASGLLNTVAFASWVFTRVDRTVNSLVNLEPLATALLRRHWKLLLMLWLLLLAITIAGARGGLWISLFTGMVFVLMPLFTILCSAVFLRIVVYLFDAASSLLLVPILFLSLASSFDLWLAPLVISVTAEACPPGTYLLRQLDARAHDGDPTPATILHSLAYDEPRVINLVAEWILERAS